MTAPVTEKPLNEDPLKGTETHDFNIREGLTSVTNESLSTGHGTETYDFIPREGLNLNHNAIGSSESERNARLQPPRGTQETFNGSDGVTTATSKVTETQDSSPQEGLRKYINGSDGATTATSKSDHARDHTRQGCQRRNHSTTQR